MTALKAAVVLTGALLLAGCNCDAGGGPCTPSFTLLVPDAGFFGSTARAVSRDGTTVVGVAGVEGEGVAFRWREATGMQLLGALPADSRHAEALAVSADGEVVVGVSTSSRVSCPDRTDEGFRWTAATGMVGLGDLDGGCFFSAAYGVSADGTLVVGTATNALANTAATWTAAAGWHDLGLSTELDHTSSLAAVTPDKQLLLGTLRLGTSQSYQLLRVSAGVGEGLGDLAGEPTYAGFNAVSDDGRVAVGFGSPGGGPNALRWTPQGGLVDLTPSFSTFISSTASAVSADGTLAVGSVSTETGANAVLWQGVAPPARDLATLLLDAGVAVPAEYRLILGNGVAVVGKQATVVGEAVLDRGGDDPPYGFVARWCLP